MNLKETIQHHKSLNEKGILALPEVIPKVKIEQIVEEALRGNYHLSMVFSNEVKVSERDFLIASLDALEFNSYDISEELSSYNLKEYTYNKLVNEIWFNETKEFLNAKKITQENCILIYKLKEKDELTFLLKTKTQYIFIQEIYWRS